MSEFEISVRLAWPGAALVAMLKAEGAALVAMLKAEGAGAARVQRNASAPNAASTTRAQAATVRFEWRGVKVWEGCMGFLMAGKGEKQLLALEETPAVPAVNRPKQRFYPELQGQCLEARGNAGPVWPIGRGRAEYDGPFLLFSHWMHMTQDGQPTPGSLDAPRGRFEAQSRKAQTYYTIMHAIRSVVGNDDAAHAWMTAPLPAFEGRTPAELVGEGRADDVLGHIRTLQPGK